MLVEVNATTRLRAGVYILGSASASKPISTVQYRQSTAGHVSKSGALKSPLIHSTPGLLHDVLDNATGRIPDCTSLSKMYPPTIPVAPQTRFDISVPLSLR